MKSQFVKDVGYMTLGRLSVVNLLRYKLTGQVPGHQNGGPLLLHLGSGPHPIKGFVNIDGNPWRRPDLWLDLTLGLPFPDGSATGAYCCHTLEHFFEPDVRQILGDVLRVLRPGGGLRIVTPDMGKAIAAYQRENSAWFSEFPDSRRSIGGRFTNYMLCRDQHRLMFDFSFMREILQDLGFVDIAEFTPHASVLFDTGYLATFEYEQPDDNHSLFVEAFKPGAVRQTGLRVAG
jgi:predicted SAM-dependent methyltransferase